MLCKLSYAIKNQLKAPVLFPDNASRECTAGGTWEEKTNYSQVSRWQPQQNFLKNILKKKIISVSAQCEIIFRSPDELLDLSVYIYTTGQAGETSLVQLRHYCALIGRELHSDATPALLCHKEPAQGTQRKNELSLKGAFLAFWWFFMA